MDMERIRRAVNSIELPEDAKARMVSSLGTHAESVRPRRRGHVRILAAAAVAAALLATAAGAAYVREFRNPGIVDNWEDMRTPPPAYSDDEPNSYSAIMGVEGYVPPTLEEQTATRQKKSKTWDTDENIGGSVTGNHEWTNFEVLVGSGDVLIRDIFATDGAVKREYAAEDPALLAAQLDGSVSIDFAKLEERFDCVPYADLYYAESSSGGSLNGTVFMALYDAGGGGWVQVECDTLYTNSLSGADYVLADTYDKVYSYTNAAGLEFVITVNGDSISADCTMEHTRLGVTAAYTSTDEVEAALDCILSAGE